MLLDILIPTLLAVHILVSLLMVFFVLMQRPKNEGLGAAFGGGMTDNLFGAQATNFLQKITVYLGGAFFALTMVLAILYAYQARKKDSVVVIDPTTPAAAVATPGASPAASPGAAPANSVEGAPAATTPSTAASPAASPVTDSASPATSSTPATDAAATTAPTPLTDTAAPATATPAAAVESSSSPAASPANP